jgi:hypothetical protein
MPHEPLPGRPYNLTRADGMPEQVPNSQSFSAASPGIQAD